VTGRPRLAEVLADGLPVSGAVLSVLIAHYGADGVRDEMVTAVLAAKAAEGHAVEVIGVRAGWWAEQVSLPQIAVIIDSGRLARTGEDPFELARYLSSGNDCGACDYSTDTGGGTAVRDAETGVILARFAGGVFAPRAASPFRDLPGESGINPGPAPL
jgi:hypothetical protein